MRSPVVERMLEKMKHDKWYVKLRRWYVIKVHIYKCFIKTKLK